MADGLRRRVLDATFAEVEAHGMRGLTVEGVAVRSGSSRATIYRHFPGGREELVSSTIEREVGRFFRDLIAEAPPADDVVGHVVGIVAGADRLLRHHPVLQRLLEDEAEAILPPLATVHPMIQDGLARHLRWVLTDATLRPGVDAAEAADHCSRMVLSFVGSNGAWDLSDPADVRDLVETHMVAGLLE